MFASVRSTLSSGRRTPPALHHHVVRTPRPAGRHRKARRGGGFAAGRRVPAGLADTSFKRIATGFLTAAELERAVRDQAVTTVLSASGRFARMPGFEAYAARAMTVTWREGDATLYRVTDAGSGTPSRGR